MGGTGQRAQDPGYQMSQFSTDVQWTALRSREDPGLFCAVGLCSQRSAQSGALQALRFPCMKPVYMMMEGVCRQSVGYNADGLCTIPTTHGRRSKREESCHITVDSTPEFRVSACKRGLQTTVWGSNAAHCPIS